MTSEKEQKRMNLSDKIKKIDSLYEIIKDFQRVLSSQKKVELENNRHISPDDDTQVGFKK